MPARQVKDPVSAVSVPELIRLGRIAGRLLAGRVSFTAGRQHNRNRAGPGTEFLDFREYRSGDDLRHVDWRVTARSDRPYIRRYQDERRADWYVCLDRSASMNTRDNDKWSLAVQLAAVFAYLFLHLGNRVGLLQFSSGIDRVCAPGWGSAQYVRIATQLRNSHPRDSAGDSVLSSCARVLRPNQNVIVVSDFLKPDAMSADLRLLRSTGRDTHAVQILSMGDTDLQGSGSCTLRDAETGQQMQISLPAGDTATHELQRLVRELEEFSRHHHIPFSSCTTRQTWKDVAVRHLQRIRHA